MAQSLTQLYTHLIFSTKNRQPMILDRIRDDLRAYIGGILRDLQSPSIAIATVADHVHILYRQSKNHALIKIVRDVKANSSQWLKTQGAEYAGFRWQNGYGAFSVSASRLDAVKRYVLNQEDHHKNVTFQEEFRRFLEEYGLEFDERYVWD